MKLWGGGIPHTSPKKAWINPCIVRFCTWTLESFGLDILRVFTEKLRQPTGR